MTLATFPSGVRCGTASTKVHKTSLESARRHPTISFRTGFWSQSLGGLEAFPMGLPFRLLERPSSEGRTAPSVRFFFTHSKSLQSCSICKLYFRLGTKQDNADVQVMDEIAKRSSLARSASSASLWAVISRTMAGHRAFRQHHQRPENCPMRVSPCFVRQINSSSRTSDSL